MGMMRRRILKSHVKKLDWLNLELVRFQRQHWHKKTTHFSPPGLVLVSNHNLQKQIFFLWFFILYFEKTLEFHIVAQKSLTKERKKKYFCKYRKLSASLDSVLISVTNHLWIMIYDILPTYDFVAYLWFIAHLWFCCLFMIYCLFIWGLCVVSLHSLFTKDYFWSGDDSFILPVVQNHIYDLWFIHMIMIYNDDDDDKGND